MEKPAVAKSKIKFLMFLPKPASASAASLQNHQNQYVFSPGKVNLNKLKCHQNFKGFSGPITSVVFEEARNKSNDSGFDTKEPTSPKISCMGQIKHKKKINKNKNKINDSCLLPKQVICPNTRVRNCVFSDTDPKKKKSGSSDVFSRDKQGRKSDDAARETSTCKLPDRAPSLSQMKRFASGREALSKIDWNRAQVAPENLDDTRCYSDTSEEEEDNCEVIIPFSAPILRAEVEPAAIPLQPKKEINLWKRRTMAQPKPLQLNTLVASCK